jgi:serine phosphatase RsbU (regulator of sigma subunit)
MLIGHDDSSQLNRRDELLSAHHRQDLGWYCLICIVASIVQVGIVWGITRGGAPLLVVTGYASVIAMASIATTIPVAIGFWVVSFRGTLEHRAFISATILLTLIAGVLWLLAITQIARGVTPNGVGGNVVLAALAVAPVLHCMGALVLPWRASESIQAPALLLIGVVAMIFWVPDSDWSAFDRFGVSLLSPVTLLPGGLIAYLRDRNREDRLEHRDLLQRVQLVGSELSRARVVHESLFPSPIKGCIDFDFHYVPAQQIGGDFVHIDVEDGDAITMTILDVAGHGLTAALTVNRLYGELQRIRAEHPTADPTLVMRLLNRYVNLTMAQHSLFATGVCMRLDPHAGTLTWVSAGHPPAFCRRSDGTVLELPCTTVILGALDDDSFDPAAMTEPISPGDFVIAYTDGVYESRNEDGESFGLDRLRTTMAFSPPPRDWIRFVSGAVEDHHQGMQEDDVLVACLMFCSQPIRSHSSVSSSNTTLVSHATKSSYAKGS